MSFILISNKIKDCGCHNIHVLFKGTVSFVKVRSKRPNDELRKINEELLKTLMSNGEGRMTPLLRIYSVYSFIFAAVVHL